MSVHADALAVLTFWVAPDPRQERLRRDYVAHLVEHADGVWRESSPAHLTVGGIVVDPERTATLLVLHGRLGAWVQPGGHCEPGDRTLADAAAREVREETGIADLTVAFAPLVLSRHRAPCASGAEWHLDVQYAVTAPRTAAPVVSHESDDVRWFDVDDLPAPLASGVADSVRAALAHPPLTAPTLPA